MILLVEDNEDDVFIMKRAIHKAALRVPMKVVTNGREAMDYLKGTEKFADRNAFPIPSLVFLDLKLPYVHGLDVLAWMKREPSLADIPVAILSSSLIDSDRKKSAALGATAFLVKPPSPEMLIDFIKSQPGCAR